MSLTSGQVVIGTTAVEVSGHSTRSVRLTVHNHEQGSGKNVWVGTGTVTTSTGMKLNGEPITFVLNPMEHLHAVTDSGTVTLGYVKQII